MPLLISQKIEHPYICSFRDGGGHTPNFRKGGRGGRGGRGGNFQRKGGFKGKCNACGQQGHHAESCWFLVKLKKALSYLKIHSNAAHETKRYFKGKNSYQDNYNTVRSLQDAHFIPYGEAPSDLFLDVVDDDPNIFSPDLLGDEK